MMQIRETIHRYEEASGQRINMEKTEIMASRNVSADLLSELCSTIGVQGVNQYQKYLGLPTIVGRSKKQIFASILERVQQKCKGWKDHTLTRAGKEIMLKAVVQAIPPYTMNCFLIPKDTIHAIESCMARFFWGSKEDERKTHWVSWTKMTRRKEEGGLGFRELHCFNLAMLARQWWHLARNQNSIIYGILKAKYFPRQDMCEASLGYRPSYLWRSLLTARRVVMEGEAWRVGDGRNILAGKDRWVGNPYPRRVLTTSDVGDAEVRVADLINHQQREWDESKVRTLFPTEAEEILAIPLSNRNVADAKIWGFTKSGQFTVKSAYRLAVSLFSSVQEQVAGPSEIHNLWSQLWKLKIIPKMSSFVWQACNEALPTRDNLIRRGVTLDPVCHLCGEGFETQVHLFLKCRITTLIWKFCPLRIERIAHMGSLKNLLWCLLDQHGVIYTSRAAVVAWNIWIARNKVYMEGQEWNMDSILRCIERWWSELETLWIQPPPKLRKVRPPDDREWAPPPRNWYKLDTDVAVISPTKIGIGWVLRNHNRELVMTAKVEREAALCWKVWESGKL